jgi:hypothetical protein
MGKEEFLNIFFFEKIIILNPQPFRRFYRTWSSLWRIYHNCCRFSHLFVEVQTFRAIWIVKVIKKSHKIVVYRKVDSRTTDRRSLPIPQNFADCGTTSYPPL